MARQSGSPAVDVFDLTLSYNRHPAVHHLTGRFDPGALTAIVGPNGAGKSTLLKGIVGFMKPNAGRIELEGIARRDIAYLPQLAALDRGFPMRVLDLAAMGLWRRAGMLRRIGKSALRDCEAAIEAVGLAGFEDRIIGTLSGGQFQRALFARLLLQEARLILLDEPFTAVDARTTEELMALCHQWHDEGRTVIAALHDIDLVRRNFPETLVLARERIAWGGTSTVLTEQNLMKARQLHEAFEDSAELCAA